MASELSARHCVPSRRGMPALDGTAVARLLAQLPGWSVRDGVLTQTFRFPGFADAIAFVNAVAEIAEAEDHHPDLTIRYDRVEVSTSTHVADGLTENDFILAARIGEVIARQPAPGPTGSIERRRPDSNR